MAETELKHLFVYGTLQRGFENRYALLLHQSAEFVGRGSITGRLYRIAAYPGAVPGNDPAERVHGELFLMSEPDALLAELDAYEGPDYQRVRCIVDLERGEQTEAWVYFWRGAVDPDRRIGSGVFSAGDEL